MGWEWWRWKWGRCRTWKDILSDSQEVVYPKMKFFGCLWTLQLWSLFCGPYHSYILLVLWRGCQKAAGFCLKSVNERKSDKVLFLETLSAMQTPGQACRGHVFMAHPPRNLSHWCVGTRQSWHKSVGPFALCTL